ncbi:conserved hypothetical protein [Histoplasma capsulatum G186AR]|uniref:Ubiquitination network signaling protein n=2 Tax=Ajellomyces capsulatus TaxID=5037 RepID=C0NN21_AJECG|nr:uncharacterized protein HCBG_04148 [Histoplasma capsulatum G186AR]EEH07269.1 conserved hypothetical protein [Histoplasma capsulatum G186AR]KAG5304605.1 ubiquitination network signaling protein [Histoplasma capsulatum]QSS70203.1 ubiquitination network signaling protein [Histoplasma capsulatum G186AR]
MPRPGGAGRKTHHGNRHENGIPVSGKKLAKPKSNGHLNGNLNGAPPPTLSSPSLVPAIQPGQPQTIARTGDHRLDAMMCSSKAESNGRAQANGYEKASTVVSNGHSYTPASTNGATPTTTLGEQTRTNVDKTGGSISSLKKTSSPSGSVNPLSLATAILKSCPMYDTIAILIFLLQLPPIVLTLVQFLFASLTFMPPAGVSTNVLTSNFDIFQGPAGTPSLSTMIAMDGFCLLVWGLFMWTWAQNFAIDLAQVQVAITMGGGSSGKNEGVNAFCVLMVLIVHVVRSKGVQDFVISYLLSAKLITTDTLAQYSHLVPQEFRRKEPPSPPSWLRSLLAVHILAQAGTAMARRSMAKNRSSPPTKSGKRTDTEASAGSQTHVDSSTFESATNGSSILTPDGAVIGPSILKENRERLSSAKKRRRQANQVRSRQPFWAALASTKVTVMREYDHSRNGTWSTPHHPITEDDAEGFPLDDGFIWITQVDNSSIKFAASDFAQVDDAMYDNRDQDIRAEPFYIRVNGAHWATVTLSKVSKNAGEPALVCWRGEISGLAPDCAYTCSFIRYDTDEAICVMSVKTPPTPDTDQALSAVNISPSPRQSLRPSSPTTTIKNSIANAEAKLNERRARLKRSKNDHKLLISRLKKEVDNFNTRLSGASDENRQRQRLLQLERTIKQTEEATAAIDIQLLNLEDVPQNELEEWNSRKCVFDQEMDRVKSLKEEVDNARIMASRSVASAKSELTSVIQKRERLQGRRQRLTEQHERITSANSQGLNERERRSAEQLAKERERASIEKTFNDQLTSITRSIQDYQIRTTHIWQQVSAVEQGNHQQQMLMTAGPLTPEGDLPGTNPPPPEASTSTMSPMPSTTRSLSGAMYTSVGTNEATGLTDRQTSISPVVATSHLSVEQQPYPSSPLVTAAPFFGPELRTHRHRSLSNFSGVNMPVDQVMPMRLRDSPDSTEEINLKRAMHFGLNTRRFTRAGSQGSASGSGTGSGSGSGSPHSSREKPSWC